MDDESYRALQLSLVLRPDQGAVISGGAGIRKMRWPGRERGKRGGLRVIYYWATGDQLIYMIYIYSKSEQGDLSKAQINAIARAVKEEMK
jgi:hypothetical protein